MCGKNAYTYSQEYGRREDIRHLLPKGADLLERVFAFEASILKVSKHKVKSVEDYEHRKMIITSHIQIRTALESQEIELPFYHYDFEKIRKTTGKGIE